MRARRLGDRRFLTLGVFALASLLELCGCGPLRKTEGIAGASLTSLRWRAVLEQCAGCVSDSAPNIVGKDEHNFAGQNGAWPSPRQELPLKALLAKGSPSFYVPELLTEEVHEGPTIRSALSLDDKPGPWTIAESVFFVYRTITTGDGRFHRVPSATAFILSVPDVTHRMPVRFLVTARHVLDPEWAHCSEKNPRSIDIRLNRRNGGVGYETVSIQNNHSSVFVTPPDGTSDLAVIQLDQHSIPNLEAYRFFDTPFRLLPTDSELRMVRPDQQIVTAGLLVRPSPEGSIYPVSHGGVLSGNSNETINMQCGKAPESTPLHVWFINAAVPQGVSGAPVFTSMSREGGIGKTPVLLGIQAVAWPDKGVAGMTPATVLNDLIHQALLHARQPMDFSKGRKP